jgi:hypothetical protein
VATLKQAAKTLKLDDPCWLKAGQDVQSFLALQPFQQGFLGTPAQQGAGSSAGMVANGKAAMELQGTWNDFFTQLIYLNDPSKYTLPLALRIFVDQTSQSAFGPMFAMSVLSLVPIGVFFLAFQRYLVEGVATSGLKG